MNIFTSKGDNLYINGKKVIKGWESFSGWYWFATEKNSEQISIINGLEVPDTLWYGLVQGLEEEWGLFSQAEIESLGKKAWKIPQKNLPWSGRRN